MEILNWLKSRIETRPTPFEWTDPKENTKGVAILREASQELEFLNKPERQPRFAAVSCLDAQALVAYMARHAYVNRSIVFAHEKGLLAVLDYCEPTAAASSLPFDSSAVESPVLHQPGDSIRRVSMPADWTQDCKSAMTTLEASVGKWIALEAMDAFLDVAAPLLKEVATLRDVLLNLDGSEIVSARRTATGSTIQTGSQVKPLGEQKLPAEIEISGVFMGQAVTMSMPLRVRARSNTLEFMIVDNGAVRIAKAKAVASAAEFVRKAGWFVIEGGLG